MERSFKGFGSTQFKVKYREIALQSGPSAISGYLGTLHKGAVMDVVGDDHPYYYLVRLDNGLEGYVYKAAGELTTGAQVTRSTPIEKATPEVTASATKTDKTTIPAPEPTGNARSAPVLPDMTMDAMRRPSTTRQAPAAPRTPPIRPAGRSSSSSNGYSSSSSGSRPLSRGGNTVVITTGEIAVFDKPGIVGRQVGRLKRGEQVTLVGNDSFFFEVSLTNGQVGFIPRYAAELV